MTMDELIDYYEDLQSEVIPAWETPLVNDLFCMIFHGALRKLCAAWLDEDIAGIHNDLVAGEAAIVSLEPVRRMQYMAAIANDNPQFVSVLRNAPIDIVQQEIARQPRFATEYENYLDQFGDRCLDELKLESETLRDDPSPLIRSIGQLAGMPERHTEGDGPRQSAEDKIASHFRSNVIRRLVFNRVLGLARSRVRDRENLRFERTRVYGRVRAVFVEIGRQLKEADLIEHRDDIFFLDVAEVIAFIRGTGVSSGLATLIEGRRREFEQYRADDDPPRRFITRGPAQLQSSISLIPTDAPESGDIRNGQACSQGVVRGQVRIVTDPRKTEFREGEILVAQRTDPGWVTIFPLVKGMIMERGSLLSHSAIVARELNIPAVVGVENACQWLEDGDWVELDGATGVIRRLGVTEQAA
jgi:pyruvate,water dikinase